jgi:hypothetical protein
MTDLDAYAAGGASLVASSAVALHAVENSFEATTFLSLIPALVGPILALVVHRMFAAKAARRVATAKFLLREAETLEATDPEKSRELRLKAEILKAEGEALHHGLWK